VVSPANIVDRSQKSDRLQLAPTFFRTTANLPQQQIGVSDQALPDGCESASSPLAHSRAGVYCTRLRVMNWMIMFMPTESIVMASLALALLLTAGVWSVAVPNVMRAEH
jgi:hypothetical protein